jgi:hypothetical protein
MGTMRLVVADIAWWAPLAIIGGALAGLAAGYALLELAGGSRAGGGGIADRIRYERTDKTNYPKLNVAAFVFVLGLVGLIVGLAVGLSGD